MCSLSPGLPFPLLGHTALCVGNPSPIPAKHKWLGAQVPRWEDYHCPHQGGSGLCPLGLQCGCSNRLPLSGPQPDSASSCDLGQSSFHLGWSGAAESNPSPPPQSGRDLSTLPPVSSQREGPWGRPLGRIRKACAKEKRGSSKRPGTSSAPGRGPRVTLGPLEAVCPFPLYWPGGAQKARDS